MIKVENLSKCYGSFTAVDSINFNVNEGEVMGFLGPNAAGKTTTMRILTGFLSPTSGNAEIAGYNVFYDSHKIKKITGYLPEKPPLYMEMTANSYLKFAGEIKGVGKHDLRKSLINVMEKTGITHVADQVIGTLSKGYKQRVGIAQALIHNPRVLILDEPTSGLDPMQIIEVRKLIQELRGDHTIILSTHILPEVSISCEKVVIIDKGKIVAIDTPQNLTRKILGGEKLKIITSGGKIEEYFKEFKKVQGVVTVNSEESVNDMDITSINCDDAYLVAPFVSKIIINNNIKLHSINKMDIDLEEIFLHATHNIKSVNDAGDKK